MPRMMLSGSRNPKVPSSVEQPDSAPKLEGSLEVRVKVGFLDVL